MKSTNLVVFTVKVETYQRNENCESKQGNQTGIYSESLETCLLHKVLQVMPVDGGVKDFPIEVLQQERILSFRSYDPERSTPDVIEFSMFSTSSFLASHFKMRSSGRNSLSLAFLSNRAFILSWYFWSFSSTSALFYWTSINWLILRVISLGSSFESCQSFITGRARFMGSTTSVPYTIWKGDIPIDFLVPI
jgi:hypothetical protein